MESKSSVPVAEASSDLLLTLVSDLVTGQKFRATAESLGIPYLRARTIEEFSTALDQYRAIRVFVDLTARPVDPYEALTRAAESASCRELFAVYSHVDTESEARAAAVRGCKTLRRSLLAKQLVTLITAPLPERQRG